MLAGRAHPHDVGEGTAAIDGEMPARGSAPGFIRSLWHAVTRAATNRLVVRRAMPSIRSMTSRRDAGTVDDQARAILDVVEHSARAREHPWPGRGIAPVCRAGLAWWTRTVRLPADSAVPWHRVVALAVALPFPPARARIASSARGWRARACRRCTAASTWTATAGMVPPATSIGCCGWQSRRGGAARSIQSHQSL